VRNGFFCRIEAIQRYDAGGCAAFMSMPRRVVASFQFGAHFLGVSAHNLHRLAVQPGRSDQFPVREEVFAADRILVVTVFPTSPSFAVRSDRVLVHFYHEKIPPALARLCDLGTVDDEYFRNQIQVAADCGQETGS
jgi:hypothetical protein